MKAPDVTSGARELPLLLPSEVNDASEGILVRSSTTSGIAPDEELIDYAPSEQIEERRDQQEWARDSLTSSVPSHETHLAARPVDIITSIVHINVPMNIATSV